ncbi:hypothetical protein EB796_000415 [Bugula neritina]|uniref:Uncharacterized protein n=1 Tax=Bugula neritina TaxID=10212 RepID=A0A7J7KT27_BUGNE|nr:hypothetical protein EB796_000415 [Bugula neritina]
MGQTTSNIVKKVNQWATGDNSQSEGATSSQCIARATFNPFVYKRKSQLYIDGDGDIAHEFYEQEKVMYKSKNGKKKRSRIIMKKVPNTQLTPLTASSSDTVCEHAVIILSSALDQY